MALLIDRRTQTIRCRECDAPVFSQPSDGSFIATYILADLSTWALTGLFVLLGFLWEPAYVIALGIVAFGIYKATKNRGRFECSKCKREYTYQQVYGD